jgi:hypothetical protein
MEMAPTIEAIAIAVTPRKPFFINAFFSPSPGGGPPILTTDETKPTYSPGLESVSLKQANFELFIASMGF